MENSHNHGIDINEIIENAKNDPDTLSSINITEILENIDKKTIDVLDNKTVQSMNETNIDLFTNYNCSPDETYDLCSRLNGYRLVNEIFELHKGKNVKIFDTKTKKLKLGGIVYNITFSDNGPQVLCMNVSKRFFQYKFNNYITFQRMSDEEHLILLVNEHILNMDK